MKMRIVRTIILTGVCLACGAGTVIPLRAAVSVEQVAWEGFADAWRLRNDEVDLVVVPEIGRIVRNGPVNGSNVLWSGRAPGGVVREITLAPAGSAVTIVTRLEPIGKSSIEGLSAWSVTQVPATSEVEARLAPDAVGPGIHDPVPGWPAPTREDRRLVFLRPADRGCKSFWMPTD